MENISLIPQSHRSALESALVKVFPSLSIDKLEQLSGGLSGSAVYKMYINDQPYVLKLDTPLEHKTEESQGMVSASEAGIAPPLYYRDASSGITITAYIQSQPIRKALASEKLVGELARTIRSIHNLPCHTPGQPLKQIIDGMVNGFLQAGLLAGPIVEECFVHYASIRERYPWDDSEKVYSHNDINPNNLLCDGERIWVIDWDSAFLNDRYVDLAAAANFFVQTDEQELELLRIYFDGAVDEYKRARFFIMRQISRILYSVLLVQAATRGKPSDRPIDREMEGNTLKAFGELMAAGKLSMATYEGQLMYGKAQMNEAVRNMRLPRFADALGRL